jgi:hypothetical protein
MIDVQALRALVEKWRATSDQMGSFTFMSGMYLMRTEPLPRQRLRRLVPVEHRL